jgi:predicted nucleic acid-binding protein
MILVDAGPLVAVIDADDRHHDACVKTLKEIRPPLVTVWPVVVEAMYLLSEFRAQDALWQMILRGVLVIEQLDARDLGRARDLMAKYRDLPMDLADAALVAIAERLRCRRVFTLDRKDFRVYRAKGFKDFEILPL